MRSPPRYLPLSRLIGRHLHFVLGYPGEGTSDYITVDPKIGIARRFMISTNRCTDSRELRPQLFQCALKDLISL